MMQRKECAHVSRPTIPTPSFSDSTDRCRNPYQKNPPPLYFLRKTKFEKIKPVKAQNKNQSREHQATKLGKVPEEECTYSDNATKHECTSLEPRSFCFPRSKQQTHYYQKHHNSDNRLLPPKNFPKRPASVTTFSTDFSFQNLVFFLEFIEFSVAVIT
jgi:hypothetical protein